MNPDRATSGGPETRELCSCRGRSRVSINNARCQVCGQRVFLSVENPKSIYSLGAHYDVYRCGGCGLGVTVPLPTPEELDRIYVTGLWGMEVFDLESKALLARKRLGFFSRVPVLDPEHDLLYVPSTVEGRIRVFDRPSLELLGTIPIGYGTRHPHWSPATKRFFASSQRAYHYWDAGELAKRFRD